jgi:hypothetical protein
MGYASRRTLGHNRPWFSQNTQVHANGNVRYDRGGTILFMNIYVLIKMALSVRNLFPCKNLKHVFL